MPECTNLVKNIIAHPMASNSTFPPLLYEDIALQNKKINSLTSWNMILIQGIIVHRI